MAYSITLPNGDVVRTDELLAGRVIDIAKRNHVSWAHVVDAPFIGDGSLMLDMYRTFCDEHGAQYDATTTMAALSACFVEIPTTETVDEDDEPVEDDDPQTVDAPMENPTPASG